MVLLERRERSSSTHPFQVDSRIWADPFSFCAAIAQHNMQGLSDNLGLTSRGQRIDNTVDLVYGRSPLVNGDLITWESGTWTTEPPLFNVPGRAPNTFLVSDGTNTLRFIAFNKTTEFTGDGI